MRNILKSVKWKRTQLIFLFIFISLSAVAQMLLPALLSKMINFGVVVNEGQAIGFYAFIMAIVTIMSCLMSFGFKLKWLLLSQLILLLS